jgi:hypothetical protein
MLLCIVFSWVHNWYLYAATTQLQFSAWGRAISFRRRTLAEFMNRGSKLFEGVTAEELNFGEFFGLVSKIANEESKEALGDTNEYNDKAKAILRHASWLGNTAFLPLYLHSPSCSSLLSRIFR